MRVQHWYVRSQFSKGDGEMKWPKYWKVFLSNDDKVQLVKVLLDTFSSAPTAPILCGREVVLVYEGCAYMSRSMGETMSCVEIESLQSNQEETDTRVLLYCICMLRTRGMQQPGWKHLIQIYSLSCFPMLVGLLTCKFYLKQGRVAQSAVLHWHQQTGRIIQCSVYSSTTWATCLFGLWQHYHHHNRFTALFLGPPGWAGARRELLDFMVQGKINRDRHTDRPAGRHSIRTNQCPPPPSHFYRPDGLILSPNQQCQSTAGNQRIRIREKTLEFSSAVLPAPSPYLVTALVHSSLKERWNHWNCCKRNIRNSMQHLQN